MDSTNMSSRFAGKSAIVTGASRGIGLATAEQLVSQGAKVVITARREEALADAVAQLGGPEVAIGVAGHAADRAHQEDVVQRAIDTFGGAGFR
jgi:NAD(P)-dependent dehydrogenase (short-subunit alcohol dehydrogenase family)